MFSLRLNYSMKKRTENDPVRIKHILDATQTALGFVANRQRPDLDDDSMLAFAVVRALSVVGEAATHVTEEFRATYPQIPWESMIDMRNWLIHAYFDVDLDIVWHTLTQELPLLITELEKIPLFTEGKDRK